MKKKILQLTLENAVAFKGKANPKAVINKIIPTVKEKSKLKSIGKEVAATVKKVNKLSLSKQKEQLKKINPRFFNKKIKVKKELIDLPNVGKNFRARFAPSASGPLHIGHALVISLNKIYADKYKGKHILRIEDTNPDANFKEFYKMIPKDYTWLAGKPSETYIQSTRIKTYYKYAEQLIKMGKLYICEETPEEVKAKLSKGIQPFGRRDEPKEVMRKWKRMLTGKYNPGEAVVRVKTDLKGKNPALKEWVAFRISGGTHPKVGNKVRVWPLMNFSVAIDDYELRMTHVIRGKDHEDNTKKQKMIYDFLGWNYPEYIHLGRINFKNMIISASDVRKGVEEGKYTGYDDDRVETLASIRKKGIKPKTLLKFFYEIGPTKRDKTVDKKEVYKTLEALNRKL